MPLISVILPVYNIKGEYLTKAVRSVLAQSFEDFELLIVDDGSRRETAAVCDELAAEDKRIMVFHNVNQGPGKSRNFRLSKAQGAFAIFMDHDDWVEKDWLKKLYESIVRNDADAAFCYADEYVEEEGAFHELAAPHFGTEVVELDDAFRDKMANVFFAPWAKLVKMEIIKRHNLAFAEDGNRFDDVLFHIFLNEYAARFSFVDEVLYHHRLFANSITGSSSQNTDMYFDVFKTIESAAIFCHMRPDGDTLGCAAALCAMLRQMGKTAALLPNAEVTSLYADYVAPYWAAEDYRYETVVSVDLAALGLFPDNAERFKNRVDLAVDHHPSYEGFGKGSCVHPECAACGEILYELAVELGQLTPAVALPLYVAVSTDTGCFVYSNVTANTHRVAAALMETGIDYRAANKRHFRTKTKKRLALEAELLRTMEFYDEGRVVVVTLPLSLAERLSLTEADMDDVSALGGVVEGTDCSITMKETKDGAWKISVRTGARVNATKACAALGGGGHRAASGCVYHGPLAEAKAAILAAVQDAAEE